MSVPPVRPDGCAPPSCSPRAAPRPRLPASSACPTRAPMSGMPVLSRAVSMPCAVGTDGPRSQAVGRPAPKVEQALLQGARANEFDTDLWTLAWVAVVITQLTGVRGCQQVMAPGTNRRRHRRRQPAHRPLPLPRRAQGGQRHLHRVPEGELADADHAGRIRQTHTLFRKRSSEQMLASTATHSSPWLPRNTDRTPTTPL
jgi:hypothetical protein